MEQKIDYLKLLYTAVQSPIHAMNIIGEIPEVSHEYKDNEEDISLIVTTGKTIRKWSIKKQSDSDVESLKNECAEKIFFFILQDGISSKRNGEAYYSYEI